ncbi:MAG TPA: GtrA family protein, partial [Candidatus Limnocylindria bacterium]|nr:GtrA family protein [Candidatus Limnocylindria bacterium]
MDNPSTQNSFEQKISALLESRPIVYQFLRFGCIGALNTALNFLILNGISKALGIDEGVKLSAVSAVSFSVAVVQSYLWNR